MTDMIKSALTRSTGLLVLKVVAFLATGSVALLAAMIDSIVDVIASLIAYTIKPAEHHAEHQVALIQSFWILAGGMIVMVESVRQFNEPVDLAYAGVIILVVTLIVDGTILRKMSGVTAPILVGLREDIRADFTNSVGAVIALSLIAIGFPSVLDKIIAMIISLVLIKKGITMCLENITEASADHMKEHGDTDEIRLAVPVLN